MNALEVFKTIMKEHTEVALATCGAGRPHVRIVNFLYDETQEGVIYFSSFGDNQKVQEFEQNNGVAFTTIPHSGNAHVRVKEATVSKSHYTVYDIKEGFIAKIPEYEETIEQVGQYLVLFEIHFKEAEVTLDFENSETICW
ncbi:MAG: pyridoxamine 5'-phosphate oxidase family protein [Cellulosilyticaceae bacterium]